MPFKLMQNLLDTNLGTIDKIRKQVLKKVNTQHDFNRQLEDSKDRLEWFVKKLKIHKGANLRPPKWVKKYEVYQCHFGFNIQSEINKHRPCVIIDRYANLSVVAPIRHGSMIQYHPADNTGGRRIELPSNNTSEPNRIKNIPNCMMPVVQDLSYYPTGANNWRRQTLNGCIDLGHIRVVSNSRLSTQPLGKITDDNIKELENRLFDFLNLDIENNQHYIALKSQYLQLELEKNEIEIENNEKIEQLGQLQNDYESLQQKYDAEIEQSQIP